MVLAVEGTISDVSFVTKSLFPFTKNNIKKYFEQNFDTFETQEIIRRLADSAKQNGKLKINSCNFLRIFLVPIPSHSKSNKNFIIKTLSEYSLSHISQRSDIPEIKQLQILIWIWGYENDLIKSHVYDQVTTVLHNWKYTQKIQIYLFSSAIILAQQLLLCNTNYGNCLPVSSLIYLIFIHLSLF